MSQWAGGVLTAAGRALQAKVEAGTTALVLTKIKLGDGTESMDAVDNLTDLVGAKAVLGISSSVADGDHATITGVIISSQLQTGFWCREWGLFAQDPDEGEILYMITIDAQPEWLPSSTAEAQVSATYAMNIAVANATNIEVQIDPAGLVDVEMLQSYMGLAKRSTAVALGDTAMLEGLPAMYFLECTTSGTTGATAPVITPPVAEGDTITDGTVVWTVRRCLPTSGGQLEAGNVVITKKDSMGQIVIIGGTTGTTGASVTLKGMTNDATGQFRLKTVNNANQSHELVGSSPLSGGTLTWDGNDLGGSAIVAKQIAGFSGYRKTADGFLIQWGKVPIAGSKVYDITYPISFANGQEIQFFCTISANSSGGTPSGTAIRTKSATYPDSTNNPVGTSVYINSINGTFYTLSWLAVSRG